MDARCTELSLTAAGELKKAEVRQCWEDMEAQLLRTHPALREPALRHSLEEIETILRARLSRLQ